MLYKVFLFLFLIIMASVGFYLFQEKPTKARVTLESGVGTESKSPLQSPVTSKQRSGSTQLDTISSKPRAPDFALPDEDEDTIFAFTAEYPIDFQVLLDESGEMIKEWPVRGLPTTFILDIHGHIVYRATGGREWDSDELLNEVRKLNMSNLDF